MLGMEKSSSKNRTCMCMELDPDFFYLIQSYAERSGLCAVHVSRAVDFLSYMKQEHPVAVCLEPEQLVDRAAWDILRAIKADSETAGIPVILFSWLDEEDQALEAGADVYVKKPVMYGNFLDALTVAGVRYENQ